MSPAPPAPAHLGPLTSLRFLVALQVVVFHYGRSLADGGPAWARSLVGGGYVGVSFFFVLSGFILAYTHFDAQGAPRVGPRDFWVARAARIYPVYLLGLLLALPFFLKQQVEEAGGVLAGLVRAGGVAALAGTLTQAWVPPAVCELNCPGWSLSTEAFFYLCFPLVGAWVVGLPRRALLPLAGVLWLVGLAFPLAYLALRPGVDWHALPEDPWLSLVKFSPPARLPEFVLGVALGRHFVGTPASGPAWGRGALELAALAAVGGVLAAGEALPYPLVHNGLLAPAFAVLVLCGARGGTLLSRGLDRPWLRRLGEASYALYVLQEPLFSAWAWLTRGLALSATARFLGYLPLLVGASLATSAWLEVPAREAVRRWLRRPARGAAAAG